MKHLRAQRKIINSLMIVLMAFWQIVQPLQAATFYWDGGDATAAGNNTNGSGLGGSGTWDTTTANWWDQATNMAWPNSPSDTAIFTGAASEVTLSGTLNAESIVFNTGGYSLTGGTLTLGGAAKIQVSNLGGLIGSTGSRAVISSMIAGSSGLSKEGAGVLALSGTNTYTGATVINNGTLSVSNMAQLGTSTSTVGVFGVGSLGWAGGTLQLQGGAVNGAGLTFNRDLSLAGRGSNAFGTALHSIGNNTITGNIVTSSVTETRLVATAGTTTINGNVQLGAGNVAQLIYGNGNMVINGLITGGTSGEIHLLKTTSGIASTLTLANSNNTFLGATRADSGTIRVTHGGQLGRSTSANIGHITFNTGVFEIRTDDPTSFSTRNISYSSNNGTVFVDHALGSSLINQVVTFGNLRQENNRSNVVFTGRNGYGINIATLSNSMNGNNNDGMTWSGNGTMTVNGTGFWGEAIADGSPTLTLTVTGEMVLNASVVGGVVGRTPIFSKTGTGQLTYNPSSVTFTNSPTFRVIQGTVNFSDVASFAGIGLLNIGNATTTAGTLTYTGSGGALAPATLGLNTTTANVYINASGTGALTIGGAITAVAGAKTLVLGGTNTADNTISSAIPAAATNLQKIGGGTWLLSGANLFTGTSTISNGTLKLAPTAAGTSTILPDAGAIIFNVDAFSQSAGGTLNYIGVNDAASAETVGALTSTAGHGIIIATPSGSGSATLTFASLGARTAGGTINVSSAGTVNVTGTAGFLNAGTYFGSSDFAFSGAGTTLRAAGYGTDVGFVDAAGGAATLTGGSHNQVMGAITAQTTIAINSLKINGANNLTLDSDQTLTVGLAAGTGIIQAGGSSIISGGAALAASAAANDFVIRVDGANTLTINTPMTVSTAGLTKSGAGTLILGAANTYSGTVRVNEGTLQMATGGLLGATDINLAVRQGATFDLKGVSIGTVGSGVNSVNGLVGAGTITNTGALATLRVGNNSASTNSAYYTGLITGAISLVKSGTGTLSLTGLNTFTGPLQFTGGTIAATTLGNIGQASSIGAGDATSVATNQESIVFVSGTSGTIQYTGSNATIFQPTGTPSVSIDRLFTITGGATGTIDSSGQFGNNVQAAGAQNNATLIFNNVNPIAYAGSGIATLGLAGNSTGDNTFVPQITNSNFAVTKSGSGLWILAPTGGNNTYAGATTISAGNLRAVDGVGLSSNSLLVLNGGIFETSGTFSRNFGTAGGELQWTGTAAGGFAAGTAPLTVTLNGGSTIVWGSTTNFNSTGVLLLSSTTATDVVTFTNNIDLNAGTRTITVADNTQTGLSGQMGTDYAILSGVISGSGASGLTKNGDGLLYITGNNTYNGNTAIEAGQVAVTSIGSGGVSSNFGNAAGTLRLGTATAGFAVTYLMYYGAGETVSRAINWNSTTGETTIDSSGSGALVLSNFSSTGNGAKTLNLRGFNTDANTISSNIGNAGGGITSVTKSDGGTWILSGNNTFTGSLTVSTGWLGLASAASAGAAGTGALVLSNGGIFASGGSALSISRALQLAANANSLFTGDQSLTFTGTVTATAGSNGQDWNIYNTLSPGATLTFNSFTSTEDTAGDTRDLIILGTGATVFNATIANHAAATTGGTTLTLSTSNNGSLTLGGGSANTYTRGTTLTQGTLILAKVQALGATTGAFSLNGGVLQTNLSGGLIGANRIQNTVTLGGTAMVSGAQSIEFGGTTAVTMGASRLLINNLSSGASLIISGNVTNSAASTLTIAGSGNTSITGLVTTGTGAQGLANSGTGTITLTGANNATGTLTANNGIITLNGASGAWTAGGFSIAGVGTLRLDNSGGENTNRMFDTGAVALQGGTLDFIGDGNGTSETAGALTINNIMGTITMSGTGPNVLTFASVSFANSGSALDLTGIASLGSTNKLIFTSAPTLTNGLLNRAMIVGDFATHTANGVEAFTAYNTSGNLNTAAATDTMELTANAGISISRTLNALKIDGTGLNIGTGSTAGSVLTLTTGSVLNTGGNNTLSIPFISVGTSGYFQTDPGTTLTVGSTIIGAGQLSKTGTGTLVFNTRQFYGSTTNVQGGTLTLNGGDNTIFPVVQVLNLDTGSTVDLNGNTQYVGALQGPGASISGAGGLLTNSGALSTFVTNVASTVNFGGQVNNAINFGRVGGAFTLTLSDAQGYTGATALLGGTTTLENNATILNTSGLDINYATLILSNNSGLQTDIGNRISDSLAISLRGGTITYNGRALTDSSELLGALTLAQGASTLTATPGGSGSYNSATLTFASLTRSAGTTVNFTGTSLGQAGNNGFIKFGTVPVTVGNLLLGSWAIANTTDFAAYAHGMGVGAVGSTGFTPYDTQEINAALVAPNAGIFASGAITNLFAQAAGSVQLASGTTTTGLLRFGGSVTNDLVFTNGGDVLHLELGGILRSNNNNATTIGTTATRGVITSGVGELVIYNAQNTLTIHSVIQGAAQLNKSGAGTLALSAANTYTLGTVVNQGTLNLAGDVGTVVIPNGGLTINGGVTGTGTTVTMATNQGQIHSGNDVTLNGRATLTLVGNNTLKSLAFNNNGGEGNPTVTVGGILTLTDATPVTVTSSNAAVLPVISGGTLSLGTGTKTFNVGAISLFGDVYTEMRSALNFTSIIIGAGTSITKSGGGLLQLSGQNTFTGGMSVTGGGIVLGANSTSLFANSLFSGPLGLGSVSMSAGTILAADDSSRTVANAFSFAGNPIFGNTGVTLDTLTLNGALTFATLGTTGLVAEINTPYLNVVLGGDIQGIGSVTAIGSTGINTISKTGPGNLSGLNLTGIGAAVPINLTNLTNTGFTLLHDGDGTSRFETINLGTITWEPVSGVLALTIGRAGSGLYFPTAAFKTIELASLNSSFLPSGLSVTNNNGYGLDVPDDIALATVSANTGPTFSVSTANTSLQIAGLTLSGKLTGGPSASGDRVLIKAGAGTLVLGNNGSNPAATDANDNTFGGAGAIIDITDGLIQVSSDAALGNAGNIIRISANSLTEGLRVTETFTTSRVIHLNAASSGIDVTRGKTLTLNSVLTYAAATNSLAKNDLGTLVLTQDNTGWDGAMTVNQGVLRITHASALGSTTGTTTIGRLGASLELDGGGLTLAENLAFAAADDNTANGVNGSGAVRAVSGANILTGTILLNAASGTNDRSRAATFTADFGASLDIQGVVTGNVGNGQNRDSWIGLGGAGTGTLSTAMALGGTLETNRYFVINKFGSGTWTITAADAHPGTRVIIKEGTLVLSGAGSLGTPTAGQETTPTVYLNPTGVLELNSNTTDVDNRLSGRALNVSGADVNLIGNAAGTTETVGAFTLREGLSIFTLDANAAGQLDFTTGALTRSIGATLLIRGDGFGSAAGAGVSTFTGNSYAYVGQLGDTGTTNKSILPWALGDTNIAGGGIGFVTSDSTGGAVNTGTNILRLLSPSEQTTDFATANANVNLSTTELLSALNNYNSLRLGSGGGVDLNYVPLTLASGGLLTLASNTGIDGFSGVSYLTTSANVELFLHTPGNLTLNVPIAGTTGAITKSGAGTLTLTAGNAAHGTVYVNDGTIKLDGGDQTILPGRSLQLNHGGTLDLNGTVQQFNLLESRLTAVLAQSDQFPGDTGGTVLNSGGSQATLVIGTGNVTFTGAIQGNIALVRSQAAALFQDWNLYSEQTYSGPTLLSGGRTQLLIEGRFANTSSIEISGATLLFSGSNGTSDAQNITNRIGDTIPVTLRGGALQFNTSAAYYTTETMGAIILAGSQNVISMSEGTVLVNQWDLTAASLSRAVDSRSTVRFYGIDSDPNDNARLFINNLNGVATTNIGDGLANNLIGGWAVFEREFASYTPGQGVGALNTQGYAGYSPNLINDGIATDNIRIGTIGTTALTGNRSINSLAMVVAGVTNLDLGGNTLTVASGGVIASNSTNGTAITITNGNLTAGGFNVGGDLYFHTFGYINGDTDTVNRDVNIGANIMNNGSGAVTVVINGGDGRGTGLDGLLLAESTNITGGNTYTGGTFVNGGRVILNNASANGTSITATGTGDLTISGGANTLGNTYQEFRSSVVYGASDQIANTATVNLIGSGRLNLNGFNQTIANLVINNTGGHNPEVTTGVGTLTISGSSITASGQNASSNAFSTINGKLALGAATTTFTVNPITWNSEVLNPIAPNLLINASIEGTNVAKNGSGVLRLSGSNAWTGSFDLQAGGLSLGSNNALSTGSLTIGNNTFLTSTADNRIIANAYTVSGGFTLRDAFNLTLSGTGTLTAGNHDISVELTQKVLTLSGVLSGATANINKIGDGVLVLGNSNNTFGGTTTITDGILRYGVANALPTGTALTVLEGGLLDISLGGTAVMVGSLAGNSATQGGVVFHGATSGTNTFTVGGDNSTTSFGGVIANAVGSILNFVKTGSGIMTLGGANQYNGSTTVVNGRLIARAVAGGSTLGTGQSLVMGGGTTSGILQLGDSSGALNQTFTALSSAGTGTASQIVSGNAAAGTLTLNLAATSTFAGNIGGSGSNEANLNLVKSGAGDLSITGTGTSLYNGTTTVNGGKLFMDTVGAFSTATTSLTLADGTEFSLRGTTANTITSYGFGASAGAKIVVGSSAGATLGFGIDGTGNTQLVLATGQTMAVTGTLTTAIYVNSAPTGGQKYVLIDGADANSLTGFGGTFNTSPVVFNGGSFTYALSFDTLVNGGGIQQWVLTPTAQPALADVWWRGDLTGLAQGVWSATLTSGTGFPSNWDDIQASATAVDALVPPDSASIVHFSSDAAANFATTLGANMTIQELIFHTGNAPTTIGSSNGTNTLTLGNTVDAAGLTIQTGANDVGISAIVALPQNQSWNIEDTARVLTLSGGLTGTARTLTVNDTTINSGTLLFSGSAATMTGTLAINAGNLVFEDTGSLNSGLDVVLGTASKAATLFVGGSSAASLATIGGLSNGTLAGSKVVGGNATLSTLAIGPASGTTTFSGALGGGGANENQFNLVKTGAGIQIINGAVTYAGSTIVREGTLRLGTSATFTPTGSLSVIANAGATAVFDFNGKSFTTIGAITLGGGASGIAQVLDTNGTKGVITLGGDIIYDATNNPGNATISTNINTGAANRIITVGNSANSANELTISGTISAITDNNLTFNGAGSGTISGNISLAWSGGTGATNDVIFASTGTWTISAKIEVEDDIAINSGTVNANAIESLDAADDVVITGTGTQGSTIVNINSASQVHTGDDIFIRGGAIVNVNTTNGINTGTDQILIGDSGSASAAAAGVLNLAANMASTNGFVLGAASGNIGNITGTGTFTSAATKFLRNGSIESGIILAGNGAITKDAIGTVTFSGERAAASTGGTNIQEGTLILDYTTNNNSKIGGVLTLGLLGNVSNSTLALNGSNTTATVQGVTSTTIAGGNTTVAVSNGTSQTATLNLGAITRNTAGGAGVVTFEYLTNDSKATSTSAAGTLGWATLSVAAGVERFAAINGSGDIVQAALTVQNDVTQWAAGQNIISSSAFTGVVDCAHIASLTFDASAASTVSLTSTGNLVVNSGGIMVDSGVGAFASTITGGSLIGSSSGILGELVVHQNNTLGSLTIASKIINSGGITKAGLGTLILSGANTFLNTGSQLSIQEGTVQLGGGNAIGDTTAVYLRQGTTLNLNNSNEVVGHLVSNSTGTIALGTGRITFNQTTNTTYAGVFTGGAGSVITFNGPLFNFNITGSTTTGFTGGVVVNSGLLQLSGAAGRLGGALSFTINKSGTLLIDNNDDAAPNDRISDSAAFTLHSADGTPSGEVTRPRGLWIRSDNDATEDETIGALTFASGASYATLDANTTGTSAVLRLTSSGWTRTAGATINVRGRNLGATANQRTGFKIDDANDTAFMTANLVGGAGAAGTDTRSIVPWAMGENMTGGAATDTNMGNTLLTYVDNVGFVPLSFTNEYSTFAAKDSNADNIRESLTADLTSLAGQTINSLVIHNNSTAASTINVTGAGAGNALVNTSGAFLFTQNTAATASTAHSVILGGFDDGVQVGSSNEYVFFVVNPSSAATTPTLTARVDSALNTTTAAVTKSGRGTLEFTAVNTYTGGTTVNEGTLLIHDNDNIGGTGAGTQGDLNLAGGTLRLAADYTDDLGSRDLLVREGGGTIQVDAATVTATNLITTGAGTLTKTGNGTLQLAGGTANTQTGVVAVNQGTLELNKTAAINAISGSALTIGGAGSNATVTLLASNQIANTTAVTVTSTSTTAMGVFNLNGFSDTIASLTMTASTVQGVLVTTGASGVLTVTGDITLNNNRNLNDASSNARNIVITGTGDIGTAAPNTGTLNLGGATRTITVQSTATGASIGNLDATIETVITNGGIIKEGDRALVLSANNTYTGATTVNNGELHLRNGSLAAGAVTVSETGGSLTNAAVLSGTGSIGGSVIIGEAGCGVGILAVGSVNSTTTLVSNYGAGANGTLELTAGGPALTVADGSQIQLGITNATYVSTGLAAVLASGAYTTAADYANANATEFSASWNVAPTSTSDMDFLNLSGSGSSLSIGDRASGTFGDGSVRVSGLSLAAPAYGQVFNLIDWKSASIIGGGFDTGGSSSYLALGNIIAGDLDLPTLGSGGWAWDVSLFASHGILVVVPEPSRALFLLLGLLGLMLRRRRR